MFVKVIRKIKYLLDKFSYKRYFYFKDSASYWNDRYKIGKNSGAGSYGRLAEFKAEIINEFVRDNDIESVIEFGCGDGNQLLLMNYRKFVGVDISEKAIRICKDIFKLDEGKQFYISKDFKNDKADLTLSLDVIYHLVEDEVFHSYMNRLFDCSKRFVIVYSSNFQKSDLPVKHVRHRYFQGWIDQFAPDFKLMTVVKNRFPYNGRDEDTSVSDFFIYSK